MFTQSCFIRTNTLSIRAHLEKLGYDVSDLPTRSYPADGIVIAKSGEAYYTTIPAKAKDCSINCGTNVGLFKALAALRDDSDKNQWITDKNNRDWVLYEDETPLKSLVCRFHKATPEELIAHFSDCCGNCRLFSDEDTEGAGWCEFHLCPKRCDDCCEDRLPKVEQAEITNDKK